MIKLLFVVLVGVGIGYTYGYLHGDAGEASLIDRGLGAVGVKHASSRGDARQAKIDSIRQARVDSLTAIIRH